LALVVLAPTFELFDEGKDLEQGTDLILMLLSIFTAIGLFIVCKRILSFLCLSLCTAIIPTDVAAFANRAIQVEVSPPELSELFCNLRI